MENINNLQKKLTNIKRGAYCFSALGRLFYVLSIGAALIAILSIIIGKGEWQKWTVIGLHLLIAGYISFIVHNAFEAIEGLIREIGEIV